jgi:dTDP-D-glucose 4,6-dehydratase
MNILITGNMGYVGPYVINQLRSFYPDARLVGFDIGYFGNCITNKDVVPECKVGLQYFGDMRKCPHHIVRDFDTIVHRTATSNDPIGDRFEEEETPEII